MLIIISLMLTVIENETLFSDFTFESEESDNSNLFKYANPI